MLGVVATALDLSPPPPLATLVVEGLEELLLSARLAEALPAAQAWCDEQGVDAIAMLLEVRMEAEFVDALGLKPAQKKLLQMRLAQMRPAGKGGGSGAPATEAAGTSGGDGGSGETNKGGGCCELM